ncbi:winged helix-turn-helix transcriptional regulator [Paenibacillus mucilaginosus]|uniref:HxlR family transcriptional regulator n=3 Tax=Paenibacillus mucilaginosus TaxID=61624 RepID=H6NND8_9BACL|nr:helix-turn-helix domain-containing protein [Paenibacillus mucilaginosus]AEI44750.1 transcriptional regulator, HxlR family [Paenibacillus mucilaginosus KNP414]AFC32517.1 HxlR family transcriptional regulator [Paenibacillus mucilaginosus 3016]AFH64835.1 HxlR family transcriptional regulator [Paenibacillus mucilaginosus K02]MCG7214805.1 helix-turn-helix transcriptional regulator [Paenibacillus mucilaginosus]WDM26291.1 helix-turn-helix transcriptional regulator [Paenibacillus mucilaginosus]
MRDTETCVPTGVKLPDTGFGYTLSLIGGKYKMIILYWLSENKVMRFNELKRSIGTISFKSLSVMLKELEADGLILRREFPQIPPKVEYSLSERGLSLLPVLHMMCEWGEKNGLPASGDAERPLPATGYQ